MFLYVQIYVQKNWNSVKMGSFYHFIASPANYLQTFYKVCKLFWKEGF